MVALHVVIYLVCLTASPLFHYLYGEPFEFPLRGSVAIVVLFWTAATYAMFRVVRFHPAVRSDYRKWLEQTPWRYGLPLPLGPVHLIVQDVLVVALLTLLSLLHVDVTPQSIPLTFGAFYLVTLAMILGTTRQSLAAYLIVFGLGGFVLARAFPLLQFAILGMLYALALHGLKGSLKAFRQWDLKAVDKELDSLQRMESWRGETSTEILGWPFDMLAPRRFPFAVGFRLALLLSIQLTWWTFVATDFVPSRDLSGPLFLAFIAWTVGAIVRGSIYINGYLPPISSAGRLRIGRLIIPRYDYVMIPLLVSVGISFATIKFYDKFDWPQRPLIVVITGIQALLLLGCPPSVDQWRLTGEHRITYVPGSQKKELQETM
jgi:hypothetical protein